MKIKLYPKELLEAAWKQDKKLYAHGDAAAPPKCLRCGSLLAAHLMVMPSAAMRMCRSVKPVAWMRPLRDAAHTPLPLAEWDAVKSGHLKKSAEKSTCYLVQTCTFSEVFKHTYQASDAAHRTPRQRTCLFPFGLRWIPLVDNLAQ